MAEGGARAATARRLGETLRGDAWWAETIPVVLVLGAFGLYATLRAFEGKYYEWGPYLSPFYSPLIDEHHHWWKLSPALLILGGPLGFRAIWQAESSTASRARVLANRAIRHGAGSACSTSGTCFSRG